MLVHLPDNHGAEAVRDGLVTTIGTLPAHLRRSLTWDQGTELAVMTMNVVDSADPPLR
jgi:IS30 family transposase